MLFLSYSSYTTPLPLPLSKHTARSDTIANHQLAPAVHQSAATRAAAQLISSIVNETTASREEFPSE